MDFAHIDDLVTGYNDLAHHGNEAVEEKLDSFDLSRLRSIYSRVTGKCPNLLKRHHLCQEILKSYANWQTDRLLQNTTKSGISSEIVKLASLLSYHESSSWSIRTFQFGDQISEEDLSFFRCQSREQFYHKCGEDLLYRSKTFSTIVQDYPHLLRIGDYTCLLDHYFQHFYENYREDYRDFLSLVVSGLNQIQFQIVKIEFDNDLLKVTFDRQVPNMGYFHLKMPDAEMLTNLESSSRRACSEQQNDSDSNRQEQGHECSNSNNGSGLVIDLLDDNGDKINSGKLKVKVDQVGEFHYSGNWYFHPALYYRFTPIDPKQEELLMREEIFSNLLV